MAKLSALLRFWKPREGRRTEEEKAHDCAWDARTNEMLDGKGLSPTGALMDFERDSERPAR